MPGVRRFFHTNDSERCRSETTGRLDSKVEKRMDEPVFKQVGKGLFKEMYFRLGGGEASGWTADYWQKFFEEAELDWRFMVEEPRSAEHNRMFIVTDHKAREHRMFFLTDQSEEDFFRQPGDE
ncbi:MAG: hypothetical protein QOD32_418 [Pyrinomonadaceae bacterium]|jgi:hypothetical protein|nr:hypothetical protein [Pyrinomonadaceae bacterium]